MSVEQTLGRVDCGRQGVKDEASNERFRGLRIFDLSDLTSPQQVGQVQTCRGSHTHSVVFEDKDRIVVYNSGTAGVRKGEELAVAASAKSRATAAPRSSASMFGQRDHLRHLGSVEAEETRRGDRQGFCLLAFGDLQQ